MVVGKGYSFRYFPNFSMIEVELPSIFIEKEQGCRKRHAHVSPTLDIMAKKIFSLPEVTAAFIQDILELDVADAQIVEEVGVTTRHGI